jgi:hypothetical protein
MADIINEIWKEVELNSRYEISTLGNIRTKEMVLLGRNRHRTIKSHNIKVHFDSDGYLTMTRYEKHKNIKSHIHRMMAIVFISNPLNLPQVNHKDGNKSNNSLNNLEWCSASDNVKHSFLLGLGVTGEKHHNSKLSTIEVLEIRKLFKEGKTRKELVDKYKVSRSNIERIINNKTRKYE